MDYRNEVGVILFNATPKLIKINIGDRVAQAVLLKTETINWELVDELSTTERNLGGFGHTGN